MNFKSPSLKVITVTAIGAAIAFSTQCSKDPAESGDVTVSFVQQAKDWQYGDLAYKHANKIVSFGPRPAESAALEKSRQYIQAELEKAGWLVQRQAFTAKTPEGTKQFVNLYARYQKKGTQATEVWQRSHHAVIGAHIDTKMIPGIQYLGAVDAAGSVGAIMEMANLLGKKFPDKAEKLEFVFFDGEEAIKKDIIYNRPGDISAQDGLYGSQYYASTRNHERKFGIILDLVGYKNQKIKVPADSPMSLLKTMRTAASQNGVSAQFLKSKDSFVDDHIPLNRYGTPTIDLIGDFNSENNWWHKKGDTMEKLSTEELGKVIKVAVDMVAIELAR